MGSYRSVDVALASGSTKTTTGVQIGEYSEMCIECPTFTSGGTHYIQGSADNSTFRRLAVLNDDGSVADIQIPQAVSGFVRVPEYPGIRYLKMENTSGITDTVSTFIVYFR